MRDPDLPDHTISARRALAELNRVRVHDLDVGDHHIRVITRRNPLQALSALRSRSTPPAGTLPASADPRVNTAAV